MNLSKLAIRRPITVLMTVLVVLVFGAVSFLRLPVDLFPEVDLPMALIWTEYEGAGPEEVESMVTRPLEEAIGSLGNLKSMTSRSSAGASIIMARFNWGTNMDFASLEIRENVDMVRGFLPAEAGSPMIFRFDPAIMPVLQAGMSGDMDRAALTALAHDVVKNRLERIDGVAAVGVEGGLVSEVAVNVDLDRLAAAGIPLSQLEQALVLENMNFVGGGFSAGGRQFQVRTLGQFRSLEEMGGIVIGQDGAGPVYLRDVAGLKMAYKDDQAISRMDGEDTVSLNVRKQSDANTVRVAAAVKKAMGQLERELPGNVRFQVAIDTSEFIVLSINNVLNVVLIGALLAVLILFLFLGSFSSTLIISAAIPISVIGVFSLMHFRNMSLNIVTLGGMALGVGMMVDNAIVVLENIYRYRKLGEKPVEAALTGSREVTGAITAATLTTIVVFVPVVFVEGIAAIIFSPLAWTVAFALFVSLLVAVTVVPALSSRILLLDREHRGFLKALLDGVQVFLDKVYAHYGRLLARALAHRWKVVALVIGALLLSFALVPLVGFEFLPSEDSGMIFINLDLPVGSSLDETAEAALQIEEIIGRNYPEVETVFSFIGAGGGFFDSRTPEKALIYLNLVGQRERQASTREVAERLRRELGDLPGADISVQDQDVFGGGFSGGEAPINIAVKGDDLEILQELTAAIARIVEGVEGTREVSTSFAYGRPEVQVRLDRERAAELGITTSQVASAVRASLDGRVVTRYRVGGNEYDVRVRAGEGRRVADAGDLRMLPLLTPRGQAVPLGQVARVEMGTGPSTIIRENQVRTAYVEGHLWQRDIGSAMREIQRQIAAELELPLGFTLEYGGELADIQESFASLALALALAVVLVYMIMAAQFESLLFPFIIMFSLPQALIGVILSLVLTGKALSITAFIGVIMLSGIVVNNGIVLVDYINILRRERGYGRDEAIREAGPVRLRPILLTTLTTILGMLPLALGLGEGSEAQAPMAIVIIGGLSVSTLITLVFVPVVYTLLDDMGLWLKGRLLKILGTGETS